MRFKCLDGLSVTTLQGTLVTSQGAAPGQLRFGEKIEEVRFEEVSGATSLTQSFILPGFIDTHVHGGGGGDTMDGPVGVRKLAQFHLQHGTTTLYPTTITAPWASVVATLRGVQEVKEIDREVLPSLPGVHLEGPFISPKRLGAQPPFTLEPSTERVEEVLALGVVKLVTLAPEVPGALPAARRFAEAGVRVSIGHTTASFEQVQAFVREVRVAGGVVGFTHLYNAMGGLQGREPGVVGAAFVDQESYAELIFDTHHVHPGSFLAALSAKPERLHLITDGIRACGLNEGETELGGQRVVVKNGAARLPNGTLAGSILTLDQALRNAVLVGLPLKKVSQLLSEVPARYMGLNDRGTLEIGKRADLVVLDENLAVLEVYVAGQKVEVEEIEV